MTSASESKTAFARRLAARRGDASRSLPHPRQAIDLLAAVMTLLFPHCGEGGDRTEIGVLRELDTLEQTVKTALSPLASALPLPAEQLAAEFVSELPGLFEKLCLDAESIFQGDPAAHSTDEVILAYPGFFAIAVYRIAHEFYRRDVPVFPRMLTEHAHERTGIDINPGAKIGRSFFIDHGTGIVVGETTVIEDNVKLYQGVTLGALSVDKGKANTKRHPTIQANSVIYSNATILGGDTVIGHDSIIGGNVWLTESVPPFSIVYHHSEVKVRQGGGIKV